MTGNKNAWRAPLAGLASLAMIATMGVAASTANAAAPAKDYKVTFVAGNNSKVVEAYSGETLADANGGYDTESAIKAVATNGVKNDDSSKVFGGWSADGTTPVDFSKAVTSDLTLKPLWLDADYDSTKSAVVKVTIGDTVAGMSQLPAGKVFYVAKSAAIPSQLLPVDKADRQLILKYRVNIKGKIEQVPVSDVAGVTEGNPTVDNNGIILGVDTENIATDVPQLAVNGSDYANYGYPVGAKSDGDAADTAGEWCTKDVLAGSDEATPLWFTTPLTDEARKTVTVWANNNDRTQTVEAGKTVTVKDDLRLTAAKTGVSEGYNVTFKVDGKAYATDFVAKNSDNPYVKAPAAPTKDGYAFAGWKLTDGDTANKGKVYVSEENSVGDSAYHLSSYAVKSNVTFEAVWNSRVATVKVTFKDAAYDGAHKSESVEVKVPGTLTKDQAPQWTREGYTLTWYKGAAPYNFDEWITDATANFTLTAKWTQATSDTAKAALLYVFPKAYVNLYNTGTDGADIDSTLVDPKDPKSAFVYSSDDGSAFTDASWSKYKAAFKPVLEKYLTEVYNQPNTGVTAAASAEIINDLNDALSNLKFKSSSKVAAPVYRLRTGTWDNGRHHLWTTDKNEVNTLTKTTHTNGAAGWVLENTAFTALNTQDTADRANAIEGVLGTSKEYQSADKYIDSPATKSDDLPAGLNAIAKPVFRLNSDITKEHLYTTDYNEYVTLGNAGWAQEGVAFIAPAYNGTDVYRFYVPSTLQHVWTRDQNEYNTLTQQHPATYQAEGVKFQAL